MHQLLQVFLLAYGILNFKMLSLVGCWEGRNWTIVYTVI